MGVADDEVVGVQGHVHLVGQQGHLGLVHGGAGLQHQPQQLGGGQPVGLVDLGRSGLTQVDVGQHGYRQALRVDAIHQATGEFQATQDQGRISLIRPELHHVVRGVEVGGGRLGTDTHELPEGGGVEVHGASEHAAPIPGEGAGEEHHRTGHRPDPQEQVAGVVKGILGVESEGLRHSAHAVPEDGIVVPDIATVRFGVDGVGIGHQPLDTVILPCDVAQGPPDLQVGTFKHDMAYFLILTRSPRQHYFVPDDDFAHASTSFIYLRQLGNIFPLAW